MPRSGFVSMTIPKMLYDDLKSIYEGNHLGFARMGINSLSGFYAYVAYEWLKEHDLVPKDAGACHKQPDKKRMPEEG